MEKLQRNTSKYLEKLSLYILYVYYDTLKIIMMKLKTEKDVLGPLLFLILL